MVKEYWMNKKENEERAKTHTDAMQRLYAKEIADCVSHTRTYHSVTDLFSFSGITYGSPDVVVDDISTVDAIAKYMNGHTAVLNFASYKEPGGKFIEGSMAQEEALCHSSFLYNVLSQCPEY